MVLAVIWWSQLDALKAQFMVQGDHLPYGRNFLTLPATSSSNRCDQMAPKITLQSL